MVNSTEHFTGGGGRGGGRGGRNEGGAVAGGGGGGPAPIDPLAAATAAAAIELGLSPDATAEISRQNGLNNVRNNNEDGFGVYTTACKVAKKTGDFSVVFAVLSLIQRDPSFGIGETNLLKYIYHAPIINIDTNKIIELIPSLFLAKFDPSVPVKALMKQLWETIIISKKLTKLVIILQTKILDYLLLNLSSKQWRERESACSALESFLPLRPWTVVRNLGEKYFT